MYDASVERIVADGRWVTGVILAGGQEMGAGVVVANADLPYVYRCLLPDDGTAGRLAPKKYTCSTVTFYWGIDRQCPQLGPHNLFLAGDYRQSFGHILQDLTLPEEPSFYLHAPARIDPSLAPDGQDTLMVVVPVGHIDDTATKHRDAQGRNPQDWGCIQQRARQFVLKRLAQIGISDLEGHIKFEVSYAPPDWQRRYNLTKGANLGLAHNLTQMGYFRPHNRHARYQNLYFVGASTHPGNGVATVLVSARLTTERLLREMGVPQSTAVTSPAATWQRNTAGT
jgi:phytoene desaturase